MDEEAAAVVRRIFAMTMEGYGPYQISQRLTADKVEIPSVHLAHYNEGVNKNKTIKYPYVYFRGSYMDCLYEVFKRPWMKIIPAAERDFAEQIYRLHRSEYNDEYQQMVQENRLVDRELRRRQKVRRRRGKGRPLKKKQIWVYKGERLHEDKSDPEG